MAKQVSIRFSDDEHFSLSALSQKTERSINEIVREAVRQWTREEYERGLQYNRDDIEEMYGKRER